MIPAVLSCVFVLYLYRTLDAAESETDPSSGPAPSGNGSIASLTEELKGLHTRLQSLVQKSKGGDQ